MLSQFVFVLTIKTKRAVPFLVYVQFSALKDRQAMLSQFVFVLTIKTKRADPL